MSPPVAPPSPRLALVEPDGAFARLLGNWLVARGWQVKIFAHSRELLARAESLRPDLCCLSSDGPQPAGLELAALLARLPQAPPAVLCTRMGAAAAWSPEHVARLGLRAVIARPMPFPELEARLRAALQPIPPGDGTAPEESAP